MVLQIVQVFWTASLQPLNSNAWLEGKDVQKESAMDSATIFVLFLVGGLIGFAIYMAVLSRRNRSELSHGPSELEETSSRKKAV
jgi:hypothetical protein